MYGRRGLCVVPGKERWSTEVIVGGLRHGLEMAWVDEGGKRKKYQEEGEVYSTEGVGVVLAWEEKEDYIQDSGRGCCVGVGVERLGTAKRAWVLRCRGRRKAWRGC